MDPATLSFVIMMFGGSEVKQMTLSRYPYDQCLTKAEQFQKRNERKLYLCIDEKQAKKAKNFKPRR